MDRWVSMVSDVSLISASCSLVYIYIYYIHSKLYIFYICTWLFFTYKETNYILKNERNKYFTKQCEITTKYSSTKAMSAWFQIPSGWFAVSHPTIPTAGRSLCYSWLKVRCFGQEFPPWTDAPKCGGENWIPTFRPWLAGGFPTSSVSPATAPLSAEAGRPSAAWVRVCDRHSAQLQTGPRSPIGSVNWK